MKNIFLLLILLSSILFAEIDEYKTDVYFANGILTEREDAKNNAEKVLEPAIRKELYNNNENEMYNHIGKVFYAYNSTHGFIPDGIETIMQKFGLQKLIDLFESLHLNITSHLKDITLQTQKYKKSIKDGHKVLVVAHSQGNLFTYESYNALDDWMKDYFEAVSIASPMSEDIKLGTTRIDWDNDIVPRIATFGQKFPAMLPTKVRNVTFSSNNPFPEITSGFVNSSNLGRSFYIHPFTYTAQEKGTNDKVHAFTFYMGENLLDSSGKEILGTFSKKPLKDTQAYDKIMTSIDTKLKQLDKKPSQWKFKEQTKCSIFGCEDKLREVEHKHVPNTFKLTDKVYPFKEDGKLYMPKNTTEYVKANYGGESINEPISKDICYELKDRDDKTIHTIDGKLNSYSKTPQRGYIEVSLAWSNKTVDMDLSVSLPDGIQDIKDIPCQTLEHFFVKNDKSMAEGVYPVYVTYKDTNISQELKTHPDIFVSIKVPGGTEMRNVSFKVLDSLANGHIADIVVEENKIKFVPTDDFKQKTTIIYTSHNSGYSSNVGGSSNNNYGGGSGGNYNGGNQYSGSWTMPITPNFENEIDFIYYILWHISKADLGALAGADVTIYEASKFDSSSDSGTDPIWGSKTTYGSTVYTAGIIAWDRDVINRLDDEKSYVVKVDGGDDIDVNDDTIVDNSPTINLGSIHALVTGAQLKNIGLKVNIITEIAYQITKDRLKSSTESIMKRSDEVLKCLINKDFNLDGKINHIDGLLWSPYKNRNSVIRDYANNFTPIINKIHNAQPIYKEAYNLFAKPMLKDFHTTIAEDTQEGTIIGQIATDKNKFLSLTTNTPSFKQHLMAIDISLSNIHKTKETQS